MGRDEQEIMGKMEQIILMQKLEKLKNNCLVMIEKSIKGSWAFNFWTNTYDKLVKKYGRRVSLN